MNRAIFRVQGIMKKNSPLEVYVRYSGHCLTLVIARSCSRANLRNAIDKVKVFCFFLISSRKRYELLAFILAKILEN